MGGGGESDGMARATAFRGDVIVVNVDHYLSPEGGLHAPAALEADSA